MHSLREKVLEDGVVIGESILKVDSFLNHQIDPMLMDEVSHTFYNQFESRGVTKILTIEASGIAPSIMVAHRFKVPCLFAKKAKPSTLAHEIYQTDVHSFTKNRTNTIIVSKEFLSEDDRVLIIDDFLANGEAALGLHRLIKAAGAKTVGVGILVEKSFQPGRERLEAEGLEVMSLCRVASLKNNQVTLVEDAES
ncbi:xanthine phosphoribosyltransferase [Staphylococcus felis]|uniref:xanthine phosphoribosyltransferase n=1 Tax=Staphylococcus felis TaxID=46127 RepID=UPI000E25D26E|nr:xanthine phosphoribosyltransferase [Staphylococcus felis]REI10882.1 xanthine phosphoribosyltransferase [Staphylococcus felis]